MNNLDKRAGRKIIINNIVWKYLVGKNSVVAYSENEDRKEEKCWKIKGFNDPNLFGRGQWKKSGDGMILPSEIERWLK